MYLRPNGEIDLLFPLGLKWKSLADRPYYQVCVVDMLMTC